MATNKNEKQVMDVSKPGKSTPSASAKPVIVGHKPMVQDPMVTADTNPEIEKTDDNQDQESTESFSPAISKKIITPVTATDEGKQESGAEVSNDTNDEPAVETVEQSSSESPDAAVVDAVLDQVGDKKVQEVNEEDRKKQEHIAKLIAEKKYFIPIGKTHGKSSHFFSVSLFLLIVVLAGIVAAVDAELIDLGISLPFNLISPK